MMVDILVLAPFAAFGVGTAILGVLGWVEIARDAFRKPTVTR